VKKKDSRHKDKKREESCFLEELPPFRVQLNNVRGKEGKMGGKAKPGPCKKTPLLLLGGPTIQMELRSFGTQKKKGSPRRKKSKKLRGFSRTPTNPTWPNPDFLRGEKKEKNKKECAGDVESG